MDRNEAGVVHLRKECGEDETVKSFGRRQENQSLAFLVSTESTAPAHETLPPPAPGRVATSSWKKGAEMDSLVR